MEFSQDKGISITLQVPVLVKSSCLFVVPNASCCLRTCSAMEAPNCCCGPGDLIGHYKSYQSKAPPLVEQLPPGKQLCHRDGSWAGLRPQGGQEKHGAQEHKELVALPP